MKKQLVSNEQRSAMRFTWEAAIRLGIEHLDIEPQLVVNLLDDLDEAQATIKAMEHGDVFDGQEHQ